MEKKWKDAYKLCGFILMYEPENLTAKEFLPLIEKKIDLIATEDSSSSNDDDEDSDTEDESTENSGDDSSKDEDSNDDDSDVQISGKFCSNFQSDLFYIKFLIFRAKKNA